MAQLYLVPVKYWTDWPDEKTALAKQAPHSESTDVSYLKEQAWKVEFANQAIKIITDESAKSLVKTFKSIENQMGRSAFTNLRAEVPADIDLIFWNGEKKRNDYDKYWFVQQLCDEIKDRSEFIN